MEEEEDVIDYEDLERWVGLEANLVIGFWKEFNKAVEQKIENHELVFFPTPSGDILLVRQKDIVRVKGKDGLVRLKLAGGYDGYNIASKVARWYYETLKEIGALR